MAIVYIHRRLDIEDEFKNVFYVGIGKSEKRAFKKTNRNIHWSRIANKHGYKVEITHTSLLWEEACSIEKYLIDFYGREDLKLGNLCNLTDGGDTTIGFKFSENSKLLMSFKRKEYFKKEGSIEKNRLTQKLAYSSNEMREMRRKISNKVYSENPNLKNIISIRTKEAMSREDVKNKNLESKALSQRTEEFRNKMRIIAKNRSQKLKEKIKKSIELAMKNEKVRNKISLKSKKVSVTQLDINNNFIKKWDSASEASKKLEIDVSSIIRCCKGKQNKAGKFKFIYSNINHESNTSNQQ